ncbi:MAG: SCP2 sterol-binding domain-containing protein [Hydrogenophilales bacterium]|nr:SCP2 sterol-binding domain-containing protein [Hydrogenophilales bacterium]
MRLPNFPQPLARVLRRLPALPASASLVALLNLVAWKSLKDLDWAPLRGRRFCVHLRDTGLRAYFSVSRHGFVTEVNEQADVTFTATTEDFARLALRVDDPDTLFFNRRLLIEGNTDLGLRVKNMLDAVELETVMQHLPAALSRVVANVRLKAQQREIAGAH